MLEILLQGYVLQAFPQSSTPMTLRGGNWPDRAGQLRRFSLVRNRSGSRSRALIRIIHSRDSVFLQFAQSLFFLLLLFRQILLALFILVVRLCQFVFLPAAGLDS